jgi:hypothetical protein
LVHQDVDVVTVLLQQPAVERGAAVPPAGDGHEFAEFSYQGNHLISRMSFLSWARQIRTGRKKVFGNKGLQFPGAPE